MNRIIDFIKKHYLVILLIAIGIIAFIFINKIIGLFMFLFGWIKKTITESKIKAIQEKIDSKQEEIKNIQIQREQTEKELKEKIEAENKQIEKIREDRKNYKQDNIDLNKRINQINNMTFDEVNKELDKLLK